MKREHILKVVTIGLVILTGSLSTATAWAAPATSSAQGPRVLFFYVSR